MPRWQPENGSPSDHAETRTHSQLDIPAGRAEALFVPACDSFVTMVLFSLHSYSCALLCFCHRLLDISSRSFSPFFLEPCSNVSMFVSFSCKYLLFFSYLNISRRISCHDATNSGKSGLCKKEGDKNWQSQIEKWLLERVNRVSMSDIFKGCVQRKFQTVESWVRSMTKRCRNVESAWLRKTGNQWQGSLAHVNSEAFSRHTCLSTSHQPIKRKHLTGQRRRLMRSRSMRWVPITCTLNLETSVRRQNDRHVSNRYTRASGANVQTRTCRRLPENLGIKQLTLRYSNTV